MVRVSDHSEISAVFAPEEVAHALASENVPACGSPSHMGDVALVPGRTAATVHITIVAYIHAYKYIIINMSDC